MGLLKDLEKAYKQVTCNRNIYSRIKQKNRLIWDESVLKWGTQKETQPKNYQIKQSGPISIKTAIKAY